MFLIKWGTVQNLAKARSSVGSHLAGKFKERFPPVNATSDCESLAIHGTSPSASYVLHEKSLVKLMLTFS